MTSRKGAADKRPGPVRHLTQANLKVYRLNAFSASPFGGNPAVVLPLEKWWPDARMQAFAAEMSVSETAFLVPEGNDYSIRWFTPRTEMDICGHATLASAAVVLERLTSGGDRVVFRSQSGPLTATRSKPFYELDLPAFDWHETPVTEGMERALGVRPIEAMESNRTFAVLGTAETVRSLRPNMARIGKLYPEGFGVTAPGTGADSDVDFVSRYFAPAKGVPEDPVTGSAHCTLTPYWSRRLNRNPLQARQVSRRQGDLLVTSRGSRVGLAGKVTFVWEGVLEV